MLTILRVFVGIILLSQCIHGASIGYAVANLGGSLGYTAGAAINAIEWKIWCIYNLPGCATKRLTSMANGLGSIVGGLLTGIVHSKHGWSFSGNFFLKFVNKT